jgi:hypothetical protein
MQLANRYTQLGGDGSLSPLHPQQRPVEIYKIGSLHHNSCTHEVNEIHINALDDRNLRNYR